MAFVMTVRPRLVLEGQGDLLGRCAGIEDDRLAFADQVSGLEPYGALLLDAADLALREGRAHGYLAVEDGAAMGEAQEPFFRERLQIPPHRVLGDPKGPGQLDDGYCLGLAQEVHDLELALELQHAGPRDISKV